MSIVNRLKQYINYKGISVSAFEKSVGMSNASFGKSYRIGGGIGTDKLEKILNIYTDINHTWLLTGNGDMIQSNTNSSIESAGVCHRDPRDIEMIELQRYRITDLEGKLTEVMDLKFARNAVHSSSTSSKPQN